MNRINDMTEKLLGRPLVVLCLAYIAGLCAADRIGLFPMICIMLVSVVAVLCLLIPQKRVKHYLILLILMPLMITVGYLRVAVLPVSDELRDKVDQKTQAVVLGVIDDVSLRKDSVMLTVSDVRALVGGEEYTAPGIHVYAESDELSGISGIGSYVLISGMFYPYMDATVPGQFDEGAYYGVRHISGKLYADVMYEASELIVGSDSRAIEFKSGEALNVPETGVLAGGYYRIAGMLYTVRSSLAVGLSRVFPENMMGTVLAILTGERGLMDSEIRALYSEGGVAHILSISGLHVMLIGMALFALLLKLTKRLRLSAVVTISASVLYALFTGCSVSTVRAVLMITLILLGRVLGKAADGLNSCGLAALIILLYEPGFLTDSGFLMSFVSVGGICICSDMMDALRIEKRPLRRVITGCYVQLILVPLIMGSYYYISPYAVLINLLVIPLMPVVIVSGALSAVLGIWEVTAVVGRFMAGPAYFVLRGYEAICDVTVHAPGGHILTGAPDRHGLILFYAVVLFTAVCVVMFERRLILCALALCAVVFIRIAPLFTMTFVDVGQGGCIVISTRDTDILVDCGSSGISSVGKYRLLPFLQYSGIDHLDAVIVTHPDSDHANGLEELFRSEYALIDRMYVGANVDTAHKLVRMAESAGITVDYISAGESVICDDPKLHMICINPRADYMYKSDNSASVVISLEYGGMSALLTGDSDSAAEQLYLEMMAQLGLPQSYDIYDVAHHGSRYSNSELLLDTVRPTIAVVSCSKYNSYGHPAPDAVLRILDSGAVIYGTYEHGTVIVSYNGANFTVF